MIGQAVGVSRHDSKDDYIVYLLSIYVQISDWYAYGQSHSLKGILSFFFYKHYSLLTTVCNP